MRARAIAAGFLSMIAAGWGAMLLGADGTPDLDPVRVLYRLPFAMPQPVCGVYSFYVCARAVGTPGLTVSELQQELAPIGPQGVSLRRLSELASAKGIPARALVLDLPQLIETDQPAILHVNRHHFIAFLGTQQERLVLFDSRYGLFSCPVAQFPKQYEWEGAALVFGPPPPWWERALRWPAVGLLALGILFATIAGAGTFSLFGKWSVPLRNRGGRK